MHFTQTLLAFASVGAVVSFPTLDARRTHAQNIHRRDDLSNDDYSGLKTWNQTSPDVMCASPFGDSLEQNIALWWGTGALVSLDNFISMHNPDDPQGKDPHTPGTGKGWFRLLKQLVFKADGEMPNCADAGSGDCSLDSQVCYNLLRGVNPQNPSGPKTGYGDVRAYWILKQVSTFHGIWGRLHEELVQNSAINASLRIDIIKKDFAPPESAFFNVFSGLGGGVSIATGLAGMAGMAQPYSGLFSLASGIFGIAAAVAAAKKSSPDDMTDLNEIAASYFGAFSETMSDIANDALGYGDQRNLPASLCTNSYFNSNQAAQFFDQAKWLYTNDDVMNSDLTAVIKQSSSAIEQRLVMQAITGQNNFIMIWDGNRGKTMDQAWCDSRTKAYRTAVWMPDLEGGKCVELLAGSSGEGGNWDHTNCDHSGDDMDDCIYEPRRPTADWVDKAIDKYGVDLTQVIPNAVDCAMNNPGDVDLTTMSLGGTGLPHCYFGLYVKRGDWDVGGSRVISGRTGKWANVAYWQTSTDVWKPDQS